MALAPTNDFRVGMLEAQALVKRLDLHTLPIDPFRIASDQEILVEPKDVDGGVSGMLLRSGNSFGIVYATHISSTGFQRFSVAHELGHYFLPGHPEKLLPQASSVHMSRAGYTSEDHFEREADDFAAGLLMPTQLIRNELGRRKDGLKAVEFLANACQTSLVASAIRYIDVTSAPAAMLVSHGDHVDFCFLSDEMCEFHGVRGLKRRSAVPKGSLTERFNRDPSLIASATRERADCELTDWFDGSASVEAMEEVVGLGSYGRVLTLITASVTADELEDGEPDQPRWR